MGHYVKALGQHKINTSTIEKAALDLAERWNAPVIYGYDDDWIGEEGDGSFEFIETGRTKKSKWNEYLLSDKLYMDKKYRAAEHEGELWYEFSLKRDPDIYDISIYHDSFECHSYFDSRWWSFLKFFIGDWNEFNYLNEYRKSVQSEVYEMGGAAVLYCDDQGASSYIRDECIQEKWCYLKNKAETDFGEAFLNVSEFMLTPPGKRNYKQIEYKAFFDDFADL